MSPEENGGASSMENYDQKRGNPCKLCMPVVAPTKPGAHQTRARIKARMMSGPTRSPWPDAFSKSRIIFLTSPPSTPFPDSGSIYHFASSRSQPAGPECTCECRRRRREIARLLCRYFSAILGVCGLAGIQPQVHTRRGTTRNTLAQVPFAIFKTVWGVGLTS